MKRYWILTSIGLGLALVSPVVAANPAPAGNPPVYVQPCPPVPCLPGQVMPGQVMPGQPYMPPPGNLPPANITPPGTPPAPGTTPPPGTNPPGATPPAPTPAPVSQAPNTEAFAQAPAAGTTGNDTFNPNMIGDLAAGSYILGNITVTDYGFITRQTFRGPNGQGFLRTTRTLSNGQVQSQTTVPFAFTSTPTTTVTGFVDHNAVRQVLTPQTSRGAFKIAENENPRPTDRFFITYNYFNGVGSGIAGIPTYDVHREAFGFEKTFLQGDASIGLRMNTLQGTGDGSLGADVFGDMTVISKFALINNLTTGNLLSVGMAVTVPTGPDAILPSGSRINSLLLQPYYGFIWNRDRFFAQGFSSLVVPTDSRDVTLSVTSVGAGYRLFQAADASDSILSYVVPTTEFHATIPVNHVGTDRQPIGFPDLFVVTNGLHFGLGARTDFTLAVAVPVSGPKTFDLEAIAQINWRFGPSASQNRARPSPTFAGS